MEENQLNRAKSESESKRDQMEADNCSVWVRKIKKGGRGTDKDETIERHISLGAKNTASMKAGERM